MMPKQKGILVIISGPSGSGKGTIVKELIQKERYALSISVTTRKPRFTEEEGIHYFFRTHEQFQEMIEQGEMLEYADFCGNYYGTPKSYVEEQLQNGKDVILEIEVQGALQVKSLYAESIFVFVIPPTLDELRSRLTHRGTEDECIIEKRIKRALEEIKLIAQYDYVVTNDVILKAVSDIHSIVRAEHLKPKRNEIWKEYTKGDDH